ncbi:Uncharacterized protein QTN25_003001 [Entamoeba marina]
MDTTFEFFPMRHLTEGNTMVDKQILLTPQKITLISENGKIKEDIQYDEVTNCLQIDENSVGMKIGNKQLFFFSNDANRIVNLITSYKN